MKTTVRAESCLIPYTPPYPPSSGVKSDCALVSGDLKGTRSPDTGSTQRRIYQELIHTHQPFLLRTAWRLCLGNHDLAQDLVQETLIRGYEAFLDGRFREGSHTRAWLMRILMNLLLNWQRQQRRLVALSSRDGEENGVENVGHMEASAADRPETALMATTLEEPLERALTLLDGDLRTCIILVSIEEFTYQETADILGIPIGTVRSRLSRARKMLYESLYDYATAHRRT